MIDASENYRIVLQKIFVDYLELTVKTHLERTTYLVHVLLL